MIHNLILLETINITFSTSSDGFWKTIIPILAALITGVATICAAKKAVDGVEKTINSKDLGALNKDIDDTKKGTKLIQQLSGKSTSNMSTDEIMKLTRGKV